MFQLRYNNGQVLLATVITIGIVGLVIAGSLILISLNSFKGVVSARQSSEATALNLGCAEKALLFIKQVPSYTGSDSFTLENNTCYYTVTNEGGDSRLITISSAVGVVIRKTEISLTIDIVTGKITIDSWQDVP
ncbi:MAG: hypothetical protein ABH822_01100 [Patescibacteria group bacterium]